MGLLDEKVAIVTGGGRGVGRGIALALASEGANVIVCGRSVSYLEETCSSIVDRGGSALSIQCDVTKPAQLSLLVQFALQSYGTVDLLINNAMEIPHGTLLEISEETIEAAWQSGPMAALRLMRLCHPYLRGGGAIVNVSSHSSIYPDSPARGIYAATKSALNAISRAAAVEWGNEGIRVNVIFPTSTSESMSQLSYDEPERHQRILDEIPLGRIGDPESDIGRAIVFLCGADSGYITGATLPVNGGRSHLR
jgi:NAD(P)-dependent dehydrogenase (short-subunit alcohol dehydrogenase family)